MANQLERLENGFAQLFGVRYAVSSTSGTASVHVALGAINPDPGDEVITTPLTDFGSIGPILQQTAIPIFADVDPRTMTLDPADVEAKITPRTRAIIAVHLFGQPADLDALADIARRHRIELIEDCSQAHLIKYHGRTCGTIGRIAAFSLQSSKHLSTGEGGMTITDDEDLAIRAALFQDKGWPRSWWGRGHTERTHLFMAPCYRMPDLVAAVGVAQLPRVPGIVEARMHVGTKLTDLIAGTPGIIPPYVREGCTHGYWSYAVRVEPQTLGVDGAEFANLLRAEGLPASAAYPGKPMYAYPALVEKHTFGKSHFPFGSPYGRDVNYANWHCPEAERWLKEGLQISVNESYSDGDLNDIARGVAKVAEALASRR